MCKIELQIKIIYRLDVLGSTVLIVVPIKVCVTAPRGLAGALNILQIARNFGQKCHLFKFARGFFLDTAHSDLSWHTKSCLDTGLDFLISIFNPGLLDIQLATLLINSKKKEMYAKKFIGFAWQATLALFSMRC